MDFNELDKVILIFAKELADRVALEPIQQLEASIFDPMMRRMQRNALLSASAKSVWTKDVRPILVEKAAPYPQLMAELDKRAELFEVTMVGLVQHRLYQDPAVLSDVTWRHETPSDETSTVLSPPTSDPIWGYVLTFDEKRRQLVYVVGTERGEFGLSWRFENPQWYADNRIPFRTGELAQPFQGFWDESRGGIACWALATSETAAGGGSALGLLLTDGVINPIEQTGTVPSGPPAISLAYGVIFGHDEARHVTLALGSQTLWQLDVRGEWSVLAKVPPGMIGTRWFSGHQGSVYDPTGRRVIFMWKDWEGLTLRLLAWDGTALQKVATAGLPALSAAGIVLLQRGGEVLALTGNGGWFALSGAAWIPVGTAPVRFELARLGADPDRDHFLIGPGKVYNAAGSTVEDAAFNIGKPSGWRRLGKDRVGSGSAQSARLLCSATSGVYALGADWQLRRRQSGAWIEHSGSEPNREAPIALTTSGDDRLWAVERSGAVRCFAQGTWTQVAAAGARFGERRGVQLTFDERRNRLVAWGSEPGNDAGSATLELDLTAALPAWQVLADAGSPLPRDEVRRQTRGDDSRYFLLYDSHYERPVFFATSAVSVLHDRKWVQLPTQRLGSALDAKQRLIFHDPLSHETLGLCLKRRCLIRFDLRGLKILAHLAPPPGAVDLESKQPARPLQCDWVYNQNAGELTLFVDERLADGYHVKLEPIRQKATQRGARAPYPYKQPDAVPAEILHAVKAAAQRVAKAILPDQVQAMTGLPTSQCPDFLLREVAIQGAQAVGPAALQEALQLQGLKTAAQELHFADLEPHFIAELTVLLVAQRSW